MEHHPGESRLCSAQGCDRICSFDQFDWDICHMCNKIYCSACVDTQDGVIEGSEDDWTCGACYDNPNGPGWFKVGFAHRGGFASFNTESRPPVEHVDYTA